jgi:hypothetical protein
MVCKRAKLKYFWNCASHDGWAKKSGIAFKALRSKAILYSLYSI